MDKELFERLNQPLYHPSFIWSTRLKWIFNREKLVKFIHLYQAQERQGGYCKKRCGLLRFRNFGKHCLHEVEKRISDLELPSLQEGAIVVLEYEKFDYQHSTGIPENLSDETAFRVINIMLTTLGRKNDFNTIQRVLEITKMN